MKILIPFQKIKTKIKFYTKVIVFSVSLLVLTNCGSDGNSVAAALNCGGGAWPKQIEKELNAFINAATDFSKDNTSANCEKYKKAGLDYLKALNNVKKCVASTGIADYNVALNEAKNEINNINCN